MIADARPGEAQRDSRMMRPFLVATMMLAMAACQGGAPSETADAASETADAASAPPTQLERSMLGPDADDPYFLARFRGCAAFASYTYCQAEMYGGLPQ
jgi:hypothetical protein